MRSEAMWQVNNLTVRGTTCARIVKLLREAGATEVHMRVSAPPFRNPCYYGTDIDSRENLIANNHTIDEIKQIIGVDSLGYLSTDSLCRLIGTKKGEGYCDACFTANYPTAIPSNTDKDRFEQKINEKRD